MHKAQVVRVAFAGMPMLLSTEANAETIDWLREELDRDAFEPDVIRALHDSVRGGQCCFEIGSWVGVYSILLSTLVGREGSIFLFEPDPVAREACRQNLNLNWCENAVLLPFAISNRNGEQLLYSKGTFGDSQSSLVRRPKADSIGTRSCNVLTCTLDDFVRMGGVSPDFVKIDVEGAELDVLDGGSEVLSRRGVMSITEVHARILRRLGTDPLSIVARFRSLGKRTWLLDADPYEVTAGDAKVLAGRRTFHILAAD
jgi:FkbM family methyltransferase